MCVTAFAVAALEKMDRESDKSRRSKGRRTEERTDAKVLLHMDLSLRVDIE